MRGARFVAVVALVWGLLVSGGCASSAKRRDSRADGNSGYSYRERGTDDVGDLSQRQVASIRATTQSWNWPLKDSQLTSHYGYRGSDHHDGVDLRASRKTPVYSVGPGVVLYSSDRIRGYGKMVVIRHEDELSTVYAHNDKLLVKKGAKVEGGQLIALSGNTGRSSGPHVHFEVRKGTLALDPLAVMPSIGANPIGERKSRVAKTRRITQKSRRLEVAREPAAESRRTRSRRSRHLVRDDGARTSQSSRVTRRRIVRSGESQRAEHARANR